MFFKRFLLLIVLITGVASAQKYGSLPGTVSDQGGTPVADATVYAVPLGVALGLIIPHVSTDANGHYVFDRLQYGRYAVSPAKPDNGYPPLYIGFYGGSAKQPEVELSDQNKVVTLGLKLGKTGGILIGSVADADTGAPLDANVDFHGPESWQSSRGSGLTNARFRILIPSDTPVTMKVSQTGYDWYFTRNGTAVPITLAPGETLNLEIKLKPSAASHLP